jgi:hypothetical protein
MTHVFLEWAVVVDGKVSVPRFVGVYTVEAFEGAVAVEPSMFLFVRAVVGMVGGGVFGCAADVAAEVVGRAAAFFCRMGEDVTP